MSLAIVSPPEVDEVPYSEFVSEKKRITLAFQQDAEFDSSITDGSEVQFKLLLWRELQPLVFKNVKLERTEGHEGFLFLVESDSFVYPVLVKAFKRSERSLVQLESKDFCQVEKNFEISDYSFTSNILRLNIIIRGCYATIMKSPLYFVATAIGSTENCGAKVAISRHFFVYEKYNDQENKNALLQAVFEGEHSKIAELVQTNNVDLVDENGASSLHIACLYGHFECVKELLKHKPKINLQDKDGRSALHKAAYAGHSNCLSLLISNNADINLRDINGAIPLHIAGYKNRLECATILLENGALVNAQDIHGVTPLHQVSHLGHVNLCKLILSQGGNYNIRSNEGISPLDSALHSGFGECAQLLITAGAQISDESFIHVCAFNGSADCLRLLISNGINPNSTDAELSTPLHKAAFNGHLECVKVLIQAGADINAKDEEESTPLHKSCYGGHCNCVSYFIENGVDVNALDSEGGTALHNACCNGYDDVVELLLANNASNNVGDSLGIVPLHLACENGFIKCVSLLLAYKISVEIADNEGMTPLHYAVEHPNLVELLIERGANINVQDGEGITPLFRAATRNCEETVRLLLSKGADVNIANENNEKVLDVCEGYIKKVIEEEAKGSDNEKNKKMKLYEEAAMKFNEKPKLGIEYIISSLNQDDPTVSITDEIVLFFHRYGSHLHKAKLGEVLGDIGDRNVEILTKFVNYMDFTGMAFSAALRNFLSKFRLPGEAQKIDRIMEKFARRYHENNPTIFPNEDFAYLLAFSLIMLNTDLHNPSIKHKMTKEQFVKNNTNTGLEGGDLSEEFLREMFENIETNEIKMDRDDAVFGKSLVAKSGWLTKQGGRIKTWKKRWFILSDKVLYYFKEKQEEMSKACGIVPLGDVIVRNAESKRKYCFELYTPTGNSSIKAMKRTEGKIVVGHHDSYFICAKSKAEMEEWMEAISENIFSDPFKTLIAGKLELNRGRRINSDKRIVNFNELHELINMCCLSYGGKDVILKSYPSAMIETAVKDFHHFYYYNPATRSQYLVISGAKWDTLIALSDDILKRSNLLDHYQIPQFQKSILKYYKKHFKKDIPISLIGHSLGGSAAFLLANSLEKRGYVIANITTFGQLKVLAEKQLNTYEAYPIRRVVHCHDPLVKLFPQYYHTKQKIVLLKGVHYCLLEEEESKQSLNIAEEKLMYHSADIYKQSIKDKLEVSVRVDPEKRNLYL